MADKNSLNVTISAPVNIKITEIRATYYSSDNGEDLRKIFVRVEGSTDSILVAEGAECQLFEDAVSSLMQQSLNSKLTLDIIKKLIP